MSFYRENVVWEDSKGRWNIGFYDYHEGGDNNYGYDEEWDVDYNDNFHFVSTGHGDEESAMNASPGNAGSYSIVPHKGNEEVVAKLDDNAAKLFEHVRRPNSTGTHYIQRTEASGPVKERSTSAILNEYYTLKAEALDYKLNSSSNKPNPALPNLENRVNNILNNVDGDTSDEEVSKINEARKKFTEDLQKLYDDHKRKHRRGSPNGYENSKVLRELKGVIEEAKPIDKPIRNIEKPLKKNPGEENSVAAASSNGRTPIGTAGKYHINPETGRPNKCHATKRGCPFGGVDSHYGDKATARKAFEGKMKSDNLKSFRK